MPLYFRIPLPGPFAYSKRVGGGRKRRPRVAPKTQEQLASETWVHSAAYVAGLFVVVWLPCVFVFGMPWLVPTVVLAGAWLWDSAKRDAAKRRMGG